jgi:cytochrome b561
MSERYAEAEEYSGFAKLAHWLVAACVLAMIPVGFVMIRIAPGDLQNALFDMHRSLGFVVLMLMVVRYTYRLTAGAPEPEPSLGAFQRGVSAMVHHMLYLLLLVQPLVGWAATSAFGAPSTVFRLIRMPDFVDKNEALSKTLFQIHNLLGFVIAGLLVLHISAALYHHFIRRDGVLRRMLY